MVDWYLHALVYDLKIKKWGHLSTYNFSNLGVSLPGGCATSGLHPEVAQYPSIVTSRLDFAEKS